MTRDSVSAVCGESGKANSSKSRDPSCRTTTSGVALRSNLYKVQHDYRYTDKTATTERVLRGASLSEFMVSDRAEFGDCQR